MAVPGPDPFPELIWNARLHSRQEEEQHIQKDVILEGFGQWGQKAYQHLVLLKSFFVD